MQRLVEGSMSLRREMDLMENRKGELGLGGDE